MKIADSFAERKEYILRGVKKNGPSNYECLLCNARYNDRQKAFNHLEANHVQDDFVYSCPYCPNTFKTQNSYYIHVSSYHKEEHKRAKIWGKNK